MNVDSDDDDYDKYYRKLTQCRHRMSKSSTTNNEQTESIFQPSPTVKFSMSKLYKSTSSMRSKKKFEYKIRMSPSLKADLPSCDIKTIPVLKDTLRPIRSSIFEWRVGKTKQDSKMVDDKQQKLVDVVIERLLRQKLDENYMLLNKKTSSPNRKRRKRKKTSKRKKRSKRFLSLLLVDEKWIQFVLIYVKHLNVIFFVHIVLSLSFIIRRFFYFDSFHR